MLCQYSIIDKWGDKRVYEKTSHTGMLSVYNNGTYRYKQYRFTYEISEYENTEDNRTDYK